MLGSFVQGFEVRDQQFAGSVYDWVRPFPLLVGVGLVFGYLLLGATWLVMKTEDAVQCWARGWARISLVGVVAFIAMVSIWTPLVRSAASPRAGSRGRTSPSSRRCRSPPGCSRSGCGVSLDRARDVAPFFAVDRPLPHVLPRASASASGRTSCRTRSACGRRRPRPRSQAFLLVGTLFLLPIIIVYTGWSYYVFRGKVRRTRGTIESRKVKDQHDQRQDHSHRARRLPDRVVQGAPHLQPVVRQQGHRRGRRADGRQGARTIPRSSSAWSGSPTFAARW